MSAGLTHSCGISTAPTALQYCWGNNLSGQLGDGRAPLPSAQASGIQGFTFAQIEAGSRNHTCGVDATDVAFCWGAGRTGQLGNGGPADQFNPRAVSTLGAPATYDFLSAGSFHSCGIATNGGAYCWGQDLEGSLGNPGVISTTTPVPVGAPN
jgi:alpha-tubulin suppressor-like RCC1 family protein